MPRNDAESASPLTETTRSPSADNRTPEAAQPLVEALNHADKNVRLDAAMALGEKADPELAGRLAARLWEEPDFYVRETMTWALTRVPDSAFPPVLAALKHDRPETRVQALHVLSKFADPRAVDHVVAMVDDDDASVSAKARWALSRIGDPGALPHLMNLMGYGDSEYQNGLTTTLASFGERAVPEMVEALASADVNVRRHAADVLCYISTPAAEPAVHALAAASADPDSQVAISAIMALGELDSPEATEYLEARRDTPALEPVVDRLLERRRARAERAERLERRRQQMRSKSSGV